MIKVKTHDGDQSNLVDWLKARGPGYKQSAWTPRCPPMPSPLRAGPIWQPCDLGAEAQHQSECKAGVCEAEGCAPVAQVGLARGGVLPEPNTERGQAAVLAQDTDALVACAQHSRISWPHPLKRQGTHQHASCWCAQQCSCSGSIASSCRSVLLSVTSKHLHPGTYSCRRPAAPQQPRWLPAAVPFHGETHMGCTDTPAS